MGSPYRGERAVLILEPALADLHVSSALLSAAAGSPGLSHAIGGGQAKQVESLV